MTELEKLLESYKTLTEEEIHKVLTFVETLKTQRIHESSKSLHQKD